MTPHFNFKRFNIHLTLCLLNYSQLNYTGLKEIGLCPYR
jgi:hypothetical protein